MVSRRYRRLLQRRLRRRPLLPFLLAATVAIDVTVPFLDFQNLSSTNPQMLVWGLAIGQLYLFAVWLTSARSGILLRLALSSAGVTVVTCLLSLSSRTPWTGMLPFGFTFFAVSVISCSILFAFQNRFQQGIRRNRRAQFSVGWLLMLTTLVAFAVYGATRVDWAILQNKAVWQMSASEVLGASILLLISMLIRATPMASLAMFTAYAMVCVALIVPFARDVMPWFVTIGYYTGFTIMIGAWLLALRSRRLPLPPFQLRLFGVHEEAAPESPERPLERHQAAELKEINVVV